MFRHYERIEHFFADHPLTMVGFLAILAYSWFFLVREAATIRGQKQ